MAVEVLWRRDPAIATGDNPHTWWTTAPSEPFKVVNVMTYLPMFRFVFSNIQVLILQRSGSQFPTFRFVFLPSASRPWNCRLEDLYRNKCIGSRHLSCGKEENAVSAADNLLWAIIFIRLAYLAVDNATSKWWSTTLNRLWSITSVNTSYSSIKALNKPHLSTLQNLKDNLACGAC